MSEFGRDFGHIVNELARTITKKQGVERQKIPQTEQMVLRQIGVLEHTLPKDTFQEIVRSIWSYYEPNSGVKQHYSIFAEPNTLADLKTTYGWSGPTEDYIGVKTDIARDNKEQGLTQIVEPRNIKGEVVFSQALSSMSPAWLIGRAIENKQLELSGDVVVVDMCGAPGNKTLNLLTLATNPKINSLTLVINDINASRQERVKERFETMGFEEGSNNVFTRKQGLGRDNVKITVTNFDARNTLAFETFLRSNFNKSKADLIIADVHCRGGGEMFLRPEKSPARNLEKRPSHDSLQVQILSSCLQLVNHEGLVCYSTCSHDPNENEAVLQILSNDIDFVPPQVDFDKRHFFETAREYKEDSYSREIVGVRMYPHSMDVGFFVSLVRPKL